MTWLLASVSCNILGILWDIHQQTSFPSYIDLFISDNHVISAVVHRNWSLLIYTKHRTYLLHIAGRWETPATCGHIQQDSSWVYGTSWLRIVLFWHEPNYIVLRTSHFFSLSFCSPIPHQHIMETQPPQPALSRSKSSRFAGDTLNMSLIGTQQESRHHLVHRDVADAATRNMTQDAHLTIIRKTGSSKNKQTQTVGCNYIHIVVNSRQLIVWHTTGVCRQLRDQFLAACNGKPLWSTKAFVHAVREIEHHDVVSSGIFGDEFPDKNPRERTKQASITFGEATEAYMVDVIAKSHRYKQQLIFSWFSACLLLWQGKEVGYSWNSPTCAWPWMLQTWPKKAFRALQ